MSMETDSLVSANVSAFALVSLGSAATIASSLSILQANSNAKIAALAATAFLSVALTTSAATAWMDRSTRNAKTYFKNFAEHSCVGVPAMAGLVAHAMFDAVIRGVTRAIEERVFSRLSRHSV